LIFGKLALNTTCVYLTLSNLRDEGRMQRQQCFRIKKKLVIVILLGLLTIGAFIGGFMAATAILSSETTIPTGASIVTDVNIAVYESQNATEQLTFIDWGFLLPTQTVFKILRSESKDAETSGLDSNYDFPLFNELENLLQFLNVFWT
jgi:hypothetical protein